MAALKCEICSGTLIGKPGGVFECEYCGVQYDTSWAKAKIQEIRGTVQVEGTVEVTGSVKVEGAANIDSLLKRGYLALEDRNWEEADTHFNEALNFDAECAKAYLGRLLAHYRFSDISGLATCNRNFADDNNFKKALRFADAGLKAELTEKLEASRPLAAEHREHLKALRMRTKRCEKLFAVSDTAIYSFYVKPNGKVHTEYFSSEISSNAKSYFSLIKKWDNIVEIAAYKYGVIGLSSDGNIYVVVAGYNCSEKTYNWENVCHIYAYEGDVIALRTDGTVICSGDLDLSSWSDIADVVTYSSSIIGIKKDGTVICHNVGFDLSGWTDIVDVVLGNGFVIGIRADGTLISEGDITVAYNGNRYDLSGILDLKDVISIKFVDAATYVLMENGTVSCRYSSTVYDKFAENIIAIKKNGDRRSLRFLKTDGTVVCADGQCVKDWKLFNSFETLDAEWAEAREKRAEELYQQKLRREEEEAEKRRKKEEEKRIALEKKAEEKRLAEEKAAEEKRVALEKEAEEKRKEEFMAKGLCRYCGGTFKGFIIKKCVNCGKEKDYIQQR